MVNLTTLFTRLGKLAFIFDTIDTFRAVTVPPLVLELESEYVGNLDMIPNSQSALNISFQNSPNSVLGTIRSYAINTVIKMVNDDSPQSNSGLRTALVELIRQMEAGSYYVDYNSVSFTATANGLNYGDGIINICSTPNTLDDAPLLENGKLVQWAFNESCKITCTNDSQTGGIAAGNERFQYVGDQSAKNTVDPEWPNGSGTSQTIISIDANTDYGGGSNLLVNGGFETWTVANTPDSWTIVAGTAGTGILEEDANPYTGDSSLKVIGGTGTVTLAQVFDGTTNPLLQPLTTYSVSFALRKDVDYASGTITCTLTDDSNSLTGTFDYFGNPNALSISYHTDLAATNHWYTFTTTFRTPAVLPDGLRLVIDASSLGSTHNLYIDHVSFGRATQLYAMGPYVAIHSGPTKWIRGDNFAWDSTNDFASDWQTVFEIFYGMSDAGLQLPIYGDSGGFISDSLIA